MPDNVPTLADLEMGRVALRVRDLERSVAFYRDRLGLQVLEENRGMVRLGSSGETEIVRLHEAPDAPARRPGSPGLYHFAILFPSRRDLARAFLRLYRSGWPFQGFSDHLVSEAIYFADPDGNGIEIYADRPRDRWNWRNGEVEMATLPLDMDDLLRELGNGEGGTAGANGAPISVPPETRVGHIHLHVSTLEAGERFYHGVLGLDVVTRSYPGALFMSAGGYHHHVAVNVWGRRPGVRSDEGAVGLMDFAVRLIGPGVTEAVVERCRAEGFDVSEVDGAERGWRVTDPDGHGVVLLDGAVR